MSHLAALYCLLCSYGGMILKGLLSLSIANRMLHTLCETAPMATSFDSYFLVITEYWIFGFSCAGCTDAL